jgi:hypothetical protein
MFETGAGRATKSEFSYSKEPDPIAPRRTYHWQKSILARAYFSFMRWA